jgi:hypothetical protein
MAELILTHYRLAKDMQEEVRHMLVDAKASVGKVIDQGKRLAG